MRTSRIRRSNPLVVAGRSVAALAVVGLLFLVGSSAVAAPTAVGLGTAGSFGVLAGSGITNTGPTTITGDIGTFPTTSITGATSLTLSGTNHGGDSVTQGAKTDLVTAYTTAAGEGPTTAIPADLVGMTLVPGVYSSAAAIGLSGVLTLDGAGDPSAVWVFQAGSTLITGSGSRVVLLNGAQSCHVYWQVGSSSTLGTSSTFVGTIMALTSISLQHGAQLDGRALARNGAVTLDSNTITRSACSTSTSTTTPTSTATSTLTTTPTSTATSASTTTPASTSPSNRTGAAQITAVPRGPVDTGDDSIG